MFDLDLDLALLGLSPLAALAPLTTGIEAGGASQEVTFTHREVGDRTTKTVAPSIADTVNATLSVVDRHLGLIAPQAGNLVAAVVEDTLGLYLAETQLDVFDLICVRRLAG